MSVVSKKVNASKFECVHQLIEEQPTCYHSILPINTLPGMFLVNYKITIVFNVNEFVWMKGKLSFMSTLNIVGGIIFDPNLNFRVICVFTCANN